MREPLNMKNKSVTRQQLTTIIIATLIFAVLIFANFAMLFYQAGRNVLLIQENEVLSNAVEADRIFTRNTSIINISAYTINNMMAGGVDTEMIEDYLVEQTNAFIRSVDEDFSGLYGVVNNTYVDGVGWVPEEGYVPEERPWYLEAIEEKGEAGLTTPYLDVKTGSMLVSISRMLADGKSVVSMDLSLDGIQEIVRESAEENNWDIVAVLDKNGVVAAHSDPEEFGKDYAKEVGTFGRIVHDKLTDETEGPQRFRFQGRTYWLFSSPIEDGWDFVAVMRETSLLGNLVYLILFFIFTIVLILIITTLIGKRFGKDRERRDDINRQLHAVANIYDSMYRIDVEKDTMIEIAGESNDLRVIVAGRTEHAQGTIREVMDVITDERFKERIFAFVNLATLEERLRNRTNIMKEFITNKNQHYRCRFVVVDRTIDHRPRSVIWMLENADERETQENAEEQEPKVKDE